MPVKTFSNGFKLLVQPNRFEQASRDRRVAESRVATGSGLSGRLQQALRRGHSVKIAAGDSTAPVGASRVPSPLKTSP